MNMQRINNFRMGGYLLLALGLINLRYQTGKSSILAHSLVLIIPGAALLASTFTDAGRSWLNKKAATAIVLTVGGLLVIYSFIN
jgi:ABC-type iron transport system FetAB ATPase subunit